MASPSPEWRVLPHEPIQKLEDNLWMVEGAIDGMPLRRVMTLVRRHDGTLVIHNAAALAEEAMKEIEAWGKPTILIVPSAMHRLDSAMFKKRYPELKVFCPRGGRTKVEQVVAVDGSYEDFPNGEDLSVEYVDGSNDAEGVFTVRSGARRTLVFNDAVFNMPHLQGFQGFILKHVTQSSGGPRVSRLGKMLLVKDKAKFRAHLERLAETPGLARAIVAHHQPIEGNVGGTLKSVAATL